VSEATYATRLSPAPKRTSLVRVVETNAHEGPVYVPDEDALYFTTVPRRREGARPQVDVKVLALADGRVTTVREDANVANGMTLGRDGRLVVCEQGDLDRPARIARLDPRSGEVDTLVDNWCDLRLNSPNDVVVASDGAIWFTDPSYGHLQGFRPEPLVPDRVYRYDPATERLEVAADSLDKPNGLALSPDESVLYVTDSGANQEPDSFYADRPHEIVAFDVVHGRRLAGRRVLAEISPGFPDGIKVDTDGYVYSSSFSGVQVFDPSGERLYEIELPGAVNFTFGGSGRDVLFITADTAIWAAALDAKGT
jgi:gluconolactonase